MCLAAFDEKQRTASETVATSIDGRTSTAGEDVQPLIASTVAIFRAAFGVPRLDDHFGGLRSAIANRDPKTPAKLQFLPSHRVVTSHCRLEYPQTALFEQSQCRFRFVFIILGKLVSHVLSLLGTQCGDVSFRRTLFKQELAR